MDPVKFNATANYQYMTVLGKEGAFTPENIDPKTLPAGYHAYTLIPGEDTAFKAITAKPVEPRAGWLVTTDPMSLGWNKKASLDETDWSFPDHVFDFESFFGCKLGFDAQIKLAEARREQMLSESRGKSQNRSNSRSDSQRGLAD